jgi:hypothetical protein
MLLALLLAAAPAEPVEGPHLAIVAGAGLAYAYLGAHVEIRFHRVALFAGTTPFPEAAAQWPLSKDASIVAAGIRYLANGDSGLAVSAHATRARYQHHLDTAYEGSALDPAGHDTYTATIGWRWRWNILLVEAALGAGVAHDFDHHGNGYSSTPGPLSVTTYAIPDGALAIGVEF